MRTIFYLVAAMAALAAVPGTNATEFVADDSLVASSPLDNPGGTTHTTRCSADTPQSVCPTGVDDVPNTLPVHTRGGSTVSHGFTGMVGVYTGTVESTLQWVTQAGAQGARNFKCNYSNGVITGCQGSGSFPPVGAVFAHVCKSYDLGTTTPGGSGHWGCSLTHN